MNSEQVQSRITDFQKRFGEAHLYFAYHAAFPLALTPDLAYRLWTNFQRDTQGRELTSRSGRILQIPWIAVGDLLLSNLCKEVAQELYEMEPDIRNEFLRRLRQDERFGKPRLLELAKFVETYFAQALHSHDETFRNFAQAQQWIVTAYIRPDQLAQELAQQLAERVTADDKSGIVHLSSLIETAAKPLQEIGLESLITYARFINNLIRGYQQIALEHKKRLPINSQKSLSIAGITLPIPHIESQKKNAKTPAIPFANICCNCMHDTEGQYPCASCGSPQEIQNEDPLALPPRTVLLDNYLLGRCLGSGGFGITYLGLDLQLNLRVAIKEYLPKQIAIREKDRMTVRPTTRNQAEDFEYGLTKFSDEARTVAQFNHPNIVPISLFFKANNTAYFVMRYLKGQTLEQALKSRQDGFTEQETLAVFTPILDGLTEVHSKGVLHRDLKPQNIYLLENGTPVLLDFGSARQYMVNKNRNFSVFLTPGYVPFEQYTTHSAHGPYTDIYACAATMYSCLRGYNHVKERLEPPISAPDRKTGERLPHIKNIATHPISDRLANAIMHAMELDRERRPQSISAFKEMLTRKEKITEIISEGVEILKPIHKNFANICCNCMSEAGSSRERCPTCKAPLDFTNGAPSLQPRTLLYRRYLIGKCLGRGGFGITYLGLDIELHMKVAIKEFFPRHIATRATGQTQISPNTQEHAEYYANGLEKFLEEAQMLAHFNHPAIVPVLFCFKENNTAYFVMRYIPGQTLENYVKTQGKITEAELLKIMLQILDALKVVHKENTLHRDIKPQNIYLSEDGQPLLLDFGSARQAMQNESQTLSIFFTPGYAPIEQYPYPSYKKTGKGYSKQGPWTDIYACAATMYSCFRAQIKHAYIEPPLEPTARLTTPDPLPPIQTVSRVKLSAHVAEAIRKGLEVQSDKRPQTIAEFRKLLTEAKQSVTFEILILAGEFQGQRIPLSSRPIIIGKNPDECTLVFSDKSVSRTHCIIYVKNNNVYLEDLHTATGTWVNQTKIEAGKQIIGHVGDKIGLGGNAVVFEIVRVAGQQERQEKEQNSFMGRLFKRRKHNATD